MGSGVTVTRQTLNLRDSRSESLLPNMVRQAHHLGEIDEANLSEDEKFTLSLPKGILAPQQIKKSTPLSHFSTS